MARTKTHRIVSRFHVSTGKDGAPNLCPGDLTQFSPPELCLSVGHLSGATGERLPQPSPNPAESIDASMAAGLSSAQVPRGGLLISINVKWCCPQANMKATHTHIRYDAHIHIPTHVSKSSYVRRCDGELVVLGAKIWRSDPVMLLNDRQASGTFARLMLSMRHCCPDKTLFTFVRVELISFLPFTDCSNCRVDGSCVASLW